MVALRERLAHPLTRGLDIDAPETTHLRRRVIQKKRFLRRIYQEWYAALVTSLPPGEGAVLELGSGAGFLGDVIPGLITSDLFPTAGTSAVLNGEQLPFAAGALRAIVMTNVLHHLPHPRRFLTETARCVRSGGVVAMLEPWVTPWSRTVYTKLHHEPFCPDAREWEFPSSGPLSGANGALPWIMFARDRERFEQEFPEWQIRSIIPSMPFRYLLSGGLSLRSLSPGWTFPLWSRIERSMQPWMDRWAMFAHIVLVKT